MRTVAMYAGTFDPLTLGHVDVLWRAAGIFENLIVAVAGSSTKKTIFSVEERESIVREAVTDLDNVTVESFDGLLVDHSRSRDCRVLIRGLRAISDFEFEFQMALMNRKMEPEIETLFLMPKDHFSYLSASAVREIAQLGGDVSLFVPEPSRRALEALYGPRKER